MRWGKDLLCWAHDVIRKEMSRANSNIMQSLHFFPIVFLQTVKNRQSSNELEMHLQGDLPHVQ